MKKTFFYKVLSSILFLILIPYSYGQNSNYIESLDTYLFKVDKIEFISYGDTLVKKPLLIFIRGNGPTPLIIDNTLAGSFPFDPKIINENFHLVVVSKPGIPSQVDSLNYKNINIKKGMTMFADNMDKIPDEYINKNNVDSLSARINFVISFLKDKSWIDSSDIVIVGHSAGAHVAGNLATLNSSITRIVCLSSNPYGRFQEKIRDIRTKEMFDLISHQQANQLIDSIYNNLSILYNNKNDNERLYDSDTYFSWASFTFPKLSSKLLELNIPILYAYGSADVNRLDIDYLKLDFISNNKKNLDIKCYTSYDHNFFKYSFNEDGQLLAKEYCWNEVVKDIAYWLNKTAPNKK